MVNIPEFVQDSFALSLWCAHLSLKSDFLRDRIYKARGVGLSEREKDNSQCKSSVVTIIFHLTFICGNTVWKINRILLFFFVQKCCSHTHLYFFLCIEGMCWE